MIPFWKDTVTPSLSIVIDGVLYTEEWKDIQGYEGLYQVSSFGRVRTVERYVLSKLGSQQLRKQTVRKVQISMWGYPDISLSNTLRKLKNFRLHRLVAQAFIPNPNKYGYVNHIDGDKENAFYLNLEWCSQSDNLFHAFRTGLNKGSTGNTGSKHYRSRKIAQLSMSGEVVKIWEGLREAERSGFNSTGIWKTATGKNKSHKGFLWRYVD